MKYSKLAIIATIFAFVVSSSFAYADFGFDTKELVSGEKVLTAMKEANADGILTAQEINTIEERATDKAMEEYYLLAMDEVATTINESEPTLENDQVYRKISYTFDNGATAELIFYDLAEGEVLEDLDLTDCEETSISPMSMDVVTKDHIIYRTVDKGYGSRYFTSKYRYGFPTATGVVELTAKNHYKISSAGLEATGCDLTPYYAGALTNPSCYYKITDQYAKTPGSSDINILSTLKYDRTGLVGTMRGPYYLQLDSRVGFVSIDKTNRTASVKEHVYILRTDEI
ncbi:hypothetical protein ACPW7J_08355 [Ihubacter sp. rT4E-8]|uniref:hypothetical protein n=1 Tax=unclassified Ihubacter TaxID=2633299 RepID=UPI00137A37FD